MVWRSEYPDVPLSRASAEFGDRPADRVRCRAGGPVQEGAAKKVRRVQFTGAVPRSATGRILRRELRAREGSATVS